MYIQLMSRSYGVHEPIKHIEIPCRFEDVYLSEDHINEELLLEKIPPNWLPVKPKNILLTVVKGYDGTGQAGLSIFRSWAKYFDSYVLQLRKEPEDWWGESKTTK